MKWGFKNLVRAGVSGFMYDFYIYCGKNESEKNVEELKDLQKSAQVVGKLCLTLPCNANDKLFFDNWFSTLSLFDYINIKGFLCFGTIRPIHLGDCACISNPSLKKKGRGEFDYKLNTDTGLLVAKWFDNMIVHVASNCAEINPVGPVKRWSKTAKLHQDISCPNMIMEYNKGMGGVDTANMLIALYRILIKTELWYIKP